MYEYEFIQSVTQNYINNLYINQYLNHFLFIKRFLDVNLLVVECECLKVDDGGG